MKVKESMQLIDGNGEFNVEGLQDFMTTAEFAQSGPPHAIVSIIGPQSSGKSTLMNQIFHTDFKEMDAYKGRGQTTKGIWIAKCSDIYPFTIAMDFEGTDSSQRGEDDTAFEKQSTLFALEVADIVLINMWYKDIGLEHAASRPLLKTVFQVMKCLFKPRKKTLLFVIRDHTKTPFEYLETALLEDIKKIWDAVAEPETHGSAPLSDFFKVEITALSSYEFEEEKFLQQVAKLRQSLSYSISSGVFAGDRWKDESASGFFIRAETIWKTIKDNKDLNLPALKVLIARFRCDEIAEEKLNRFISDEGWLALKEDVQAGPVSEFGERVHSILDTYLSEYDAEVINFNQDVRNAKRQQMESKALVVVDDAYDTMLEHLYSNTLESFKIRLQQSLYEGQGFIATAQSCMLEFDLGCEGASIRRGEWNALRVQETIIHVLSEIMKQLTDVLTEEVQSLLDAGKTDTWASIRNLLEQMMEAAASGFSNAVVSFNLHKTAIESKLQHLREYATDAVERKARGAAAAGRVLMHMKDRFTWVFNNDENSNSRIWTKELNIDEIERHALSASLKILSIMAAIRLDEIPDQIENVLFSCLMDGNVDVPSSQDTNRGATLDPLGSLTWEEVSPDATLLTPVECRSLWRKFKAEIENIVTQARSTAEAHRQAGIPTAKQLWSAGALLVGGVIVVSVASSPAAVALITRTSTAVLEVVGSEARHVLPGVATELRKKLVRATAVGLFGIAGALVGDAVRNKFES